MTELQKLTDEQMTGYGFTDEQKQKYKNIMSKFAKSGNKLQHQDIRKRKAPTKLSYDDERLKMWLENPYQYASQLRQLSNYFYTTSAQYKALIQYMASKPTYDYVIKRADYNPFKATNRKKYEKDYLNAINYANKIIKKSSLKKALTIAFKEDYVFAYECETDDSFFLFFLDANYCQVTSEEDGVFNFAFDFGFFTGKEDDLLPIYPKEFQQKYKKYKSSNDQNLKWQELDSSKTFCIKIHDEISHYPIIPFSTIFDDINDIEEFKRIKRIAAINDTFLALIQRIPMDEKSGEIDKYLMELDKAFFFHDMIADNLPEGAVLMTSPMAIEAIKTDRGKTDSTNVQDAYNTLYTDSGVSQFLFSSDKNSSVGLGKSIIADDQLIFNVLRQIGSWVTRKLKRLGGTYKFEIEFLDITHFNREEVQSMYEKAGSLGEPVKMRYAASIGLSPLEFLSNLELENDILKLHERMIPLQSSYTQSDEGKVGQGRDKVSDDKASDETIKSRDRDSDSRKKDG